MADFTPIHGHCQCGAVHYRVTAPAADLYHCHCGMCRRVHGTLFTTYAYVPKQGLQIEKGEDNLKTFHSSEQVHRRFCTTCGCQLFIEYDGAPDDIGYTPGTADGHPGHTEEMERHIFVGSKVPWYEIESRRPQVDEE
jgi:hypothetical protein